MKKSDWADLPMEILRMIMEKLFWFERLPSCLVCKTWHECFLEIQNEEQFLPWVMTMEQSGICNLGDLAKQASQIVEGATYDLLGYACASRYGWVLFLKNLNDHDNGLTIDYNQYILYSPFTNEVIKFPKLIKDYTSEATFSHSPGSPNFMVIVFSSQNRKICIKTCQPGDKSWKIFEFKVGKVNLIGQVACVCDFVYCLYEDEYWKLGAFNIKQQELKVSSGILPTDIDPFQSLFVAFNGDILLQSFCGCKMRMQHWRLELSEDKWIVVEDEIMKKHVIFDGCTSFTVPAVRDARQSAGMFYTFHNHNDGSDFFCFPFDPNLPFPKHKVNHGWLEGDYKWLKEDYKPLERIWIQPPFQRIWR